MPEITGTALQRLHPHPRDARITFTEEGHRYTVDGDDSSYVSVTTLIHRFFPHFDAPKVIAKIIASPKSPYYGMQPDEVQAMWNLATLQGSHLHEAIEVFFDQIADFGSIPEVAAHSVEFGYFLDFFRDHVVGKMKPYRSEMYVFDENISVCGSIDMLFASPDNDDEIFIFDWKRSKEIRTSSPFGKGLRCLGHLDDCNFNHYSLQLNMYKFILESKYGKKVVGMALVILHPRHSSYQVIPIKAMDAEIQAILLSKDEDKGNLPPVYKGNIAKYL
jgi:ATP-dependent exoDNAse (exonuclease V) beta subunit